MAEKFNTVMVNKDGLVKYPSSGQLTIPADLTLTTSTGNFALSDSGITFNSIPTFKNGLNAENWLVSTDGFDSRNGKAIVREVETNRIYLDGVDFDYVNTSQKTWRSADTEIASTAAIDKRIIEQIDANTQPSLDDGWITGFTDHSTTPSLTTTNFPIITNGNLTVSFKAKHESYIYDYNGFALTLYDNYGRKITGTGSSRVYSMNGIKIIYGYDLTSNYDGNQTTYKQTHTFTVQIGDSTVTGSNLAAVTKNYQLTKLVYAPGSSTFGAEAEDLSFILHIGNTVVDGLIPITLTVNNSSDNVTITQSSSYVMTSATWGSYTDGASMSMSANRSGYGKFMMKDIKIGSIELANYISDRGNSMDSSATEIAFFKWYDKNDPTRYITGTYYDTFAEWQIHGTNDYLLEPYKTLPFISSNTTELTLKKLQIVGDVQYFNPLIISHISNDDNSYGGYLQNVLKIDMSANYEKSLISGVGEITGYQNYYTLTSKNSYGELRLNGNAILRVGGDEYSTYSYMEVNKNEAKFGVPFKAPVYEITSNGSYNKLDEEVSFRIVKQNGNYTIVIDPPSA